MSEDDNTAIVPYTTDVVPVESEPAPEPRVIEAKYTPVPEAEQPVPSGPSARQRLLGALKRGTVRGARGLGHAASVGAGMAAGGAKEALGLTPEQQASRAEYKSAQRAEKLRLRKEALHAETNARIESLRYRSPSYHVSAAGELAAARKELELARRGRTRPRRSRYFDEDLGRYEDEYGDEDDEAVNAAAVKVARLEAEAREAQLHPVLVPQGKVERVATALKQARSVYQPLTLKPEQVGVQQPKSKSQWGFASSGGLGGGFGKGGVGTRDLSLGFKPSSVRGIASGRGLAPQMPRTRSAGYKPDLSFGFRPKPRVVAPPVLPTPPAVAPRSKGRKMKVTEAPPQPAPPVQPPRRTGRSLNFWERA